MEQIIVLNAIVFIITVGLAIEIHGLDCDGYMSSEFPGQENEISGFDDSDHATYTMNSEDSDNDITIHERVTMDKTTGPQCQCAQTSCNCSGLDLKQVPQDLPRDLKMLVLSRNSIAALPNCTFCGYIQLVYLDLSTNKLTRLEIGSFWKLHNLTALNLKNNSLLYLTQNFPNGVFSDLKSLTFLKLNRNLRSRFNSSFDYPDEALSDLISLETLYLDGLYFAVFGKYFRELLKLRKLVLAGYREGFCNITGLSNRSFENIPQVTKLNVSNCKIRCDGVSENVFLPLVNLTDLDVSFNSEWSVGCLMRELSRARELSMRTLRMSFVETWYTPSVVISKTMAQSLPTGLTSLYAQGNNFLYVEKGALELMPPNITFIDVGRNRFFYGPYIQELHALSNLKILKVSGGGDLHKIPRYLPRFTSSQPCNQVSDSEIRKELLVLKLPPKLACLDLRFAGLNYIFSELTFNETNSLESLILSNNIFPMLIGPVRGLNKLKTLFLSNCIVRSIKKEMFQHLNALEELRLKDNNLEEFFQDSSHKPTFRYLKNLKILDVSINALSAFQGEIFQNLVNLHEIDLNQNNMWQFNISIANMSSLEVLNLSHAQLSSLPAETRRHIDFLLTRHNVTVDLSYNPIHCDCENLQFLGWMVGSGAFDPKFTNYMCKYEDSSYKMITDSYRATLQYLAIKCADDSLIFLVVVSVTLCMVTFVVAAVLYRFRWKIRYMYHAAYLMFKSQRKVAAESDNFRYDVFVSYAYQDEKFILEQILPELTKRDLKVLVHGRDFAVGEFIASNIVTAVKESRKTLVVLTRDLLRSTWCHFELQMANIESAHTGRPVLLFLIKESIPTSELTSDLLYHLNKNTYIVYPQGEATSVLWDKLASDLARP